MLDAEIQPQEPTCEAKVNVANEKYPLEVVANQLSSMGIGHGFA
jgi:hypothetical protein